MSKADYEVTRVWAGVELGQVVSLKEPVHPALVANIRKVGSVKATPAAKVLEAAQAEAAKVLEAAQAEAAEIIKAATAEAEKVVTEAHAQAAALLKK